jgi:hypothetical protein
MHSKAQKCPSDQTVTGMGGAGFKINFRISRQRRRRANFFLRNRP